MTEPKKPIRMVDVAKAAGCSTMTVSLALRGSHEISEKTRERINALAHKMGYRPNPYVSALIAQRKHGCKNQAATIAVLTKFDDATRKERNDIFYQDLWAGLEQRAEELGFRLEEFPIFDSNLTAKQLNRILFNRGIKGIVLFPGGQLKQTYPQLEWSQFAIVAAAFHASKMPVNRIASDHGQSMETALEELMHRGYKRIGLAMTSTLDPSIRYAMSGRFLAWQQTQPRPRRVPLVSGKNQTPNKEELLAWIQKSKPDIILSLDPHVYQWMQALPKEIGYAHLAKKKNEPFSGINLHTIGVGRAAIDVLARELYLNRYGLPDIPEVTLIAGSWEDGTTTRPSPTPGHPAPASGRTIQLQPYD